MNDNNNLKRELSLSAATAIVVGNMIGSGIFTAPQSLAQAANPLTTILAWIITGAGSLLLALTFANLGSKYPETGGPIVYTQKAFGEFPAFLIAWTFWIGSWIGNSAIITAIIRYLTYFFPILSNNNTLSFIVASAFLWLVTFINIAGVKKAGFIGLITTILKLAVILVFAGIALYGFNSEYLSTYSSTEVQGFNTLPNAIAITLWSFVGLEGAALSAGEIENPEKNIKRSTLLGTILAAVIYLILSILAMGGLPQDALAASDAPLADIINNITGSSWGGNFISLGIIISAVGATSGWILTTARAAYAAGTDGLFPKFFGEVHHKYKTPVNALIVSSLCTNLLLILNYVSDLTNAFNFMINLATLSFIPAYAFSACAEIILTYKKDRKVNLVQFCKHGFLSLLAFFYAIYIIYGSGAESAMWVFILMLIGIPFYIYKKLQSKN